MKLMNNTFLEMSILTVYIFENTYTNTQCINLICVHTYMPVYCEYDRQYIACLLFSSLVFRLVSVNIFNLNIDHHKHATHNRVLFSINVHLQFILFM